MAWDVASWQVIKFASIVKEEIIIYFTLFHYTTLLESIKTYPEIDFILLTYPIKFES